MGSVENLSGLDLGSVEARMQRSESEIERLTAELARVQRDHDAMLVNLTHAQERGTVMLDLARANGRIAKAPPGELHALSHLSHERRLQDTRFGTPAMLLDVPYGTGAAFVPYLAAARRAAAAHCKETGRETCCWAHVILEEMYEVLVEADLKRMRSELVQSGAVCVRVIESIDLKASRPTLPPAPGEKGGGDGITLPGWTCSECSVFNGSASAWLTMCRACGTPSPLPPVKP